MSKKKKQTGWMTAPKIAAALADRGLSPTTRAGVNLMADELPPEAIRQGPRWREFDLAAVVEHIKNTRVPKPERTADPDELTARAEAIADRIDPLSPKHAPDPEDDSIDPATLRGKSFADLNTIEMAEKILALRIKRGETLKQLVPAADVRRAWSIRARQLNQALRAIPREAAAAIATDHNLTAPQTQRIEETIANAIHRTIEDLLSDGDGGALTENASAGQ